MARQPQPWYRQDRDAWFVTIHGTRHNLGPNKKKAMERFHSLMRQPKAAAQVPSEAFPALADAFLDWVAKNRSPDTYTWYQSRLERFCQRYPNLRANEVRPFHVQQWMDSYEGLSQNTRRNYGRSVKRCLRWLHQHGYLTDNPIAHMELPGAESRDRFLTLEEFETLTSFVRDQSFLQLCKTTFETGCRPQEILAVEARHFDTKNGRWVFPVREAKGKNVRESST